MIDHMRCISFVQVNIQSEKMTLDNATASRSLCMHGYDGRLRCYDVIVNIPT